MRKNIEKKIFMVSLCIFCITAGPLFVSAYSLSGAKWAAIFTDPLRYYSTSGFAEVGTARSDWNTAVDDITLSTGSSSYIYKIMDTDDSEAEWDGLSDWAAAGSYFYKCDVYINEYPIDDLNYPSAAIKSVIAHEMGHAFGLDHVTGPKIMNPSTYCSSSRYGYYSISTPQADDADGVDAIY